MYSAYKAFVGDMLCKYFLPVFGSFLSLNTVFHREKNLNFDEAQFIQFFFLFGTISKVSFPNKGSIDFLL